MMQLKLERPIIFLDLETTGVDIVSDKIVEIALLKVFPDGREEEKVRRINPGRPIPPQATAIHGITDEDVKDCPVFARIAKSLAEFVSGCDFAGFNSNRFDIPLLVEEFLNAGVDLDIHAARLIDVQTIYHKKEPRTLSAAYKFYCNTDLENAHSAVADTRATYEIFKAQMECYQDLPQDIEGLSDYSSFNNNIDFAGRFIYDEQGREVINFGKYKGRLIEEVLRTDPGYYSWIMNSSFALNTKQVLTQIKNKYIL